MPNIDLGKVVGEQGPEGPVAQGTMMSATYDPNGKKQDVFAYADAAKQEAKDYSAPKTHASQHARGGSDPLTLANIAFLGDNPIASTADDTTSNWAALGSGYAFYKSTGQLIDQPSAWGILVSFICGSDIFQIWKTQNNGPVYTRSGNASGWGQTWTKVYDTLNKPNASDIGAAASSHNHSASDITSGTLPVARGGTGQTSLANLMSQLASSANGARIATGSYVGTGNCGKDNPTTVVVGFIPKFFWICLKLSDRDGESVALMIPGGSASDSNGLFIYPFTKYFCSAGSTSRYYVTVTWGSTMSWHGYVNFDNTEYGKYQFNEAGVTYYWVAIG